MDRRVGGRTLIVCMLAAALVNWAGAAPRQVRQLPDGIAVQFDDGTVQLRVADDNAIRVSRSAEESFFARQSLIIAPMLREPIAWTHTVDAQSATIATSRVQARVDLETGAVSFFDASGKALAAEKNHAFSAATVQGEQTLHVQQHWHAQDGESLYGLGQHQLGLMDIKGHDLDLWQHNGTVIVPMLVSSHGYGILWDNTSLTRFGEVREWRPVPTLDGFRATYFAGENLDEQVASRIEQDIDVPRPDRRAPNTRIHPDLPPRGPVRIVWEGTISPSVTGPHTFQTFSSCGIKLWIDDELVIDHWRQNWLPWKDQARINLEPGKQYRIKLEWTKDQNDETVQLRWKTPPANVDTSLWSEVADGIDYYFIHGPRLDGVVAGYRRLTGPAPMMPRWAMGLWQSRQRYKTADEVTVVLEGFRSRKIPIDAIVQDWFYWPENAWGSHQFDPERFPDPVGWIKAIHEKYNAKLMISVWPKFYEGTKHFEEMQSRGFLYQPNLKEEMKDWVGYVSTFYDAFNAEARKLFWEQVRRELLVKGVDAWWLDATEPDLTPHPTLEGQRSHVHPTALGTGSRVLNAYSLMQSQAIYEGQRQAAPDQRVFILTRSAFAGQQRYAAATWSGDVSATWSAFRKQIPAGLSFCLSGIPYWTTDIGGFSVPGRFSRPDPKRADVDEWRELNTRWFQFGTFCPLLRVHGEAPIREMWEFGGDTSPAFRAQLKFDRLRYRMLPYVYSLAGAVTHEHGTMMRPLIMDFPADPSVRTISDQFMFGPSMLVTPVTTYKQRRRAVCLPAGATWYDFWTGSAFKGGQTIDVPAPFDSIPVHIRAGSIIPLGPELQYAAERPADPVTLYVYAGADGEFTLYEDDGVTYGYEQGQFSRIPLRWNDATRTLSIGQRIGTYPGMLAERSFQLVIVSQDHPAGFSFDPKPDQTVRYTGKAMNITMNKSADRPAYLDLAQSLETRVEDLLSRLTLEEKISLIHGDSKFTTSAIPRLGIPTRWLSDGPHGVREDVGPHDWRPVGRTDDYCTWLPVLMTLASTFNPELATLYGQTIGEEALHRGKHIMLCPGVNIQRTPLCGRNFEYMGEDPFLTSRLAVEYIRGVQSRQVAACVKHFAANNQEHERGSINVEMDDRTLREIYLPAFHAAVTEAGVLTVMGAYNKFRGEHCCHNDFLLNKILKNEWGFKGLVMSDWAGTHDTTQAALNGLDLEMGTDKPYADFYLSGPFAEGIRKGEFSMQLLDDKVRRNLRVVLATGVLDERPKGSFNTPEHQRVARRVAEEGIVLLKNDAQTLPLQTSTIKSIAIIGENAVRETSRGGGSAGIKAFHEITPFDGIVKRAGEHVNVTFSIGYQEPEGRRRTMDPSSQPTTAELHPDEVIDRAVAAARQADVAIVVAGLSHSNHLDDEGTDRIDLKLPWRQDELIARVAQANPRTIVVITSGAGIEMEPWLAKVPAVLQAWYPGMEGGTALASILFGDVNPSGKLPCTFVKRLGDSPAHALNAYPGENGTVRYVEGLLVGYRWFDTKQIEPLFPFGHGLSYTRFEYSNLRISNASPAVVRFDVANSGDRDGAEVAQLYVQDVKSTLPRPLKELKGFKRIELKAGEKQTVSIPLDSRALSFYDPDKACWIAEAGEFAIHVGSSSRDIRLKGSFSLRNDIVSK